MVEHEFLRLAIIDVAPAMSHVGEMKDARGMRET
jgi:hypothetical protein